ncbi:MAG: DNA alkylation repair protein [Flavobacteriales bacterium]
MKEVLDRILQIENGFLHIYKEAKQVIETYSKSECYEIALKLYNNEAHQARMLATVIMGNLAVENTNAYQFLKEKVSVDTNWRVQEMLATAFDLICKETGYEKSIPIIQEWSSDKNPNIIRAVTEGLRIWTSRSFFNANPDLAIDLIAQHKSHESEYVRKSVGNAIKDISRKHRELVENELGKWNLANPLIQFTYKYATKHLNRK